MAANIAVGSHASQGRSAGRSCAGSSSIHIGARTYSANMACNVRDTPPGLTVICFDVYRSHFKARVAAGQRRSLAGVTVDAVWVQAVLEIARAIAELHRVSRPAGLLCTEPALLHTENEDPFGSTRLTEDGHRWRFRVLERLNSGLAAGPGLVGSWALDHVVCSWTHARSAGHAAERSTLWLATLDCFIPEPLATECGSCAVFHGMSSEHTLTPREIVAQGRGAQRTLDS